MVSLKLPATRYVYKHYKVCLSLLSSFNLKFDFFTAAFDLEHSNLSYGLEFEVIAEGIGTKEQLEL